MSPLAHPPHPGADLCGELVWRIPQRNDPAIIHECSLGQLVLKGKATLFRDERYAQASDWDMPARSYYKAKFIERTRKARENCGMSQTEIAGAHGRLRYPCSTPSKAINQK